MQEKEISIGFIKKRLWLLGLLKIPMIGYCRPRLLKLDQKHVELRIKLRRKTKNHLGSMYFGALAIGADLAAGVHAFYFSEKYGMNVSLAFKGIHGEFLKRAESDVIFKCDQGEIIYNALLESKKDGERKNVPIPVIAYNDADEQVAIIEMVLSVKVK